MSDTAQKTAKPGGSKPAEDTDVEAQLQAIRDEISAMAERISLFFDDKVHAFGASADAAAKEASARARKAREKMEHSLHEAEKVVDHRIQDHPLQSILMAFGLGLLVSLLIRR